MIASGKRSSHLFQFNYFANLFYVAKIVSIYNYLLLSSCS